MCASQQKNPRISGHSPRLTTDCSEPPSSPSPVLRYGIGLDVHKDTIAICVKGQLPTAEIVSIHEHTFRNDGPGLDEMCRFLERYPDATYLMECTGVYHIPVYHRLQQMFFDHPGGKNCAIAMNPLLVHNRIADLGNKTDKADAGTMASLAFYDAILRPSYVGTEEFYTLRENVRSYNRNLTQITRLYNRIHRHLHSVNQKFFFDLKHEWAVILLDRYIARDWSLAEAYSDLIQELEAANKGAVLRKQEAEVLRNGAITLSAERRFIIQMDLLRLFNAQEAGAIFLSRAESLILKDKGMNSHYQALLAIPCVGPICALTLITELGDYSRFTSVHAFVKFCGVIPTVYSTGKLKVKGHINRSTNKYLRYALCQAAGVLLGRKDRTTDLGEYAFKQRYIKVKPFKKAMLLVAHKMAHTAYAILTDKHQYDPRYEQIRDEFKKRQQRLSKQGTLLESSQTRALRRDIQTFLVANSEYLNSTSRYHLVSGFKRLITKANQSTTHKTPNRTKRTKKAKEWR